MAQDGRRDVGLAHRLERRHEALEVIVGQVVQGQLRDAARHLLRGLEAERIAAADRRFGPVQLGGGGRQLAAHVGDFAQDVADGVGGGARPARWSAR